MGKNKKNLKNKKDDNKRRIGKPQKSNRHKKVKNIDPELWDNSNIKK